MRTDLLMTFKSHIAGKNADVVVYPDRIEWHQEARTGMSTGKKAALGFATAGLSLAVTGVSGAKKGSEVIPVRSMSSVTTEKDGMRFTKVKVICSGNTVDFRVSHGEANPIRDLLTQLIIGSHPSQHATPVAPPPPPPPAAASAPLPPPPAYATPQPTAPLPPPPVPAASPSASTVPSPAERLAVAKELFDQGLISQEDFDAKRQAILDSI